MFKWNRGQAVAILACLFLLGCSGSDDNSTTPTPTAPNAPTALRVIGTTATSIQLQWTDNATDEDKHFVEHSPADNQTFHQCAELAANVTAFTDTGLTTNTRYYYRVRAGHGTAYSTYSNEISAVAVANTAPQAPVPAFPANGATNVTQTPLLRWTAADPENDTLTYDVYFGTQATPPLLQSALTEPSLQQTSLTLGTMYYWRVVAKDGYLETTGPVWSFTTRASSASITIVAPNGGERLVKDSTFIVRWTSDQLVGNVDILLSLDGGSNWPETIVSNASNTNHSFSWTPQNLGETCRVRVQSADSHHVFDVSDADFSVYVPWDAQEGGVTEVLWHAEFVDASQGWAVGGGGKILRTTDGGTTWTAYTSMSLRPLYGVSFVDANNGWVVGDVGDILHTTDGGSEWNTQISGTATALSAVDFVNATHGWAVGWNGSIRHTTNGGASWTSQTSNTAQVLSAVAFVDTSNGWVVGDHGTILHTTNGGIQWVPQTSGTGVWLNELAFIDANYGWAVGETGKILYTANGGTNWVPQASGISIGIHGVHFADNSNGWAVGNTGTILHTTNGGGTWLAQTSRTTRTLTDVFFADGSNGWAVGFNGTIVHTNTSGE